MAATILIVGVDVDTVQLMEFLLRDAGYTTATRGDADAGIALALENRADLILCDLDMPRQAGLLVPSRLRAIERWRSVPVIAVTRMTNPGDHARIKSSGFAAYLNKPIEPSIFTSQVEKFLPSRLRCVKPLTS